MTTEAAQGRTGSISCQKLRRLKRLGLIDNLYLGSGERYQYREVALQEGIEHSQINRQAT